MMGGGGGIGRYPYRLPRCSGWADVHGRVHELPVASKVRLALAVLRQARAWQSGLPQAQARGMMDVRWEPWEPWEPTELAVLATPPSFCKFSDI